MHWFDAHMGLLWAAITKALPSFRGAHGSDPDRGPEDDGSPAVGDNSGQHGATSIEGHS